MIIIKTERVVTGEPTKQRKILSIEGCKSKDQLPQKYYTESPSIYQDRYEKEMTIRGAPDIKPGAIMTEDAFQRAISSLPKTP